MSEAFDAAAFVETMAKTMELPIEPAWRQGVIDNIAVTHRLAALVLAFPLDDHIEPAPVFEP